MTRINIGARRKNEGAEKFSPFLPYLSLPPFPSLLPFSLSSLFPPFSDPFSASSTLCPHPSLSFYFPQIRLWGLEERCKLSQLVLGCSSAEIKFGPLYTVFRKKPTYVFDYNSGVSWSIFIIFVSVEREMNTLQYTYLQS